MNQSKNLIIAVIFLSLTLFVNLYIISNATPQIIQSTQEVFRITVNSAEDNVWNEVSLWAKIASGSHGPGNFIPNDQQSVSLAYMKDCWEDTNFLRLFMDSYCILLWMMSLDHQTVVSIYDIKQFDMSGDVGYECEFDGVPGFFGVKAVWRSCSIHNEDRRLQSSFVNEIVAFHVDRILGFNRYVPAVPRLFHDSQLSLLSSLSQEEGATNSVLSILSNCGHVGFVDGVMIGHLPDQFVLLNAQEYYNVFYFHKLTKEKISFYKRGLFNIGKLSPDEDKKIALEIISFNIFSLLMDYYPPVSDLKCISYNGEFGPIIYKAFLKSDCGNSKPSMENHALTQFCKFPKRIAERLLAIESRNQSISPLIVESTQFYIDFPTDIKLTPECFDHFTEVTQFLSNSIQSCIDAHGYDSVIIDDVWNYEFNYVDKVTKLFADLK